MNSIPLFKSHYSKGRSILTLEKPDSVDPNGAQSIIKIAKDHRLKELFLVEDNPSGFLQAFINCEEQNIQLNFGLRITIAGNMLQKDEETFATQSKYVIFAKNKSGYKRLIKIYSKAAKDGFYYEPRIDFDELRKFWNEEDLTLCIPFYDSYVHKNTLQYSTCVPCFDFCNPVFFVEDNNMPFDSLIKDSVEKATSKNNGAGKIHEVIYTQTIYYDKTEDFKAYLTFRCIDNRSALDKPNLDHMCSDEFSFDKWLKINKRKRKQDQNPDILKSETTDSNTVIVLTEEEKKEAIKWGKARRDTNLNGELKDSSHSGKPMGGDWLKNDVIACGAEIAAARFLGKKFTGTVNTFNDADVDDGWQVRCTDCGHGSLIIRPWKDCKGEKLKDKFILVIYEGNKTYRMAGWKLGEQCTKKKYLKAPNNGKEAYFVPQKDLNKWTDI